MSTIRRTRSFRKIFTLKRKVKSLNDLNANQRGNEEEIENEVFTNNDHARSFRNILTEYENDVDEVLAEVLRENHKSMLILCQNVVACNISFVYATVSPRFLLKQT